LSSGLINRLVASGFIAAAVATVVCSPLSPQYSVAPGSLLARALAYVATVFAAGAITTYFLGDKDRTIYRRETALRIATAAVWLPPLLLFYGQRSWFVLVLFMAFVVELARLISTLSAMLREPVLTPAETFDAHPFSVLKHDFPYGASMLAAFMLQGAIFSAMVGRTLLAGALYLVGTFAIAYRSFQMFRDCNDAGRGNPALRTSMALLSAMLLIVFAWLPYIAVGNAGSSTDSAAGSGGAYLDARGTGSGNGNRQHQAHSAPSVSDWLKSLLLHQQGSHSHGDSFEIAKRLFESRLPKSAERTNLRSSKKDTNIRITDPITGPIFPAVELYPDEHHVTKLVAPPAVLSGGRSRGNFDPFSIPFGGVYWFWHGPSDQPPRNSVVLLGSPLAHFFRSTDGDLMSMEARQNLGFAVDPRRYRAIEIEIQNADPFPNSVSLALKIRNTALTGKPSQNLGLEKVPATASANETSHQTLRFPIPSRLAMGSFDELTVIYFLKGARANRSARIAIERFRLVPRGG